MYFDKQQFQLFFVTQYAALEEKDSLIAEMSYAKCTEKIASLHPKPETGAPYPSDMQYLPSMP